jgi:hypothetical protein
MTNRAHTHEQRGTARVRELQGLKPIAAAEIIVTAEAVTYKARQWVEARARRRSFVALLLWMTA